MGNRRYERPEVRQITKQWVRENCKHITERDMGLLRLLHENKRRILRRDQIETLYPEFASTDYLNKRLKKLFQLHVIDKVYPPVGIGEGTSKQHICLDRAGLVLLDIEKYKKPIQTDREGNRRLPLGWEHKVMLNEYECIITDFVREHGGEVLMYEVEEPYHYNDSKIIPDIMCLLKIDGKGYLFFIEVDLGTEDMPYVKKKVDNYMDFYLSKSWVKEKWAKIFRSPTFPRVLFLTENGRRKRQNALKDHSEEMAIRFRFDFHENFRTILEEITKGSQ